MNYLVATLLIIFATISSAESYKGIGALDSLKDIKSRFPNAKVEKVNPGWLKSDEALFSLTGEGMAGKIIIKFNDFRAFWKSEYEKATNPNLEESYRLLAQRSDEDALEISWLRWVPDRPIPLVRLVSKYGKPDVSGFSEEDFQPFKTWSTKGLTTYLSDDEMNVVRIDYSFTKSEIREAYKDKGMTPPPLYLEEEPAPPVNKSKKSM